jgi:hypothetical protein
MSTNEYNYRKHLWEQIQGTRGALTTANYNPGHDNFRKELVIRTFIHGPRADLHFEAKVPRSSCNELGLTIDWFPETRAEAATFLRELADLIEQESVPEGRDE